MRRSPDLAAVYISLTAVSFYIFSTYMTTFLRRVVDMPSDLVLMTNVIALTFAALIAPVIGRICDRIGRRPTMVASAAWPPHSAHN